MSETTTTMTEPQTVTVTMTEPQTVTVERPLKRCAIVGTAPSWQTCPWGIRRWRFGR